jgi:hypothetical protein
METSPIFDSFTLTVPEELSLLAGKTLRNRQTFISRTNFQHTKGRKKISLFFSHNKQKIHQFTEILFELNPKIRLYMLKILLHELQKFFGGLFAARGPQFGHVCPISMNTVKLVYNDHHCDPRPLQQVIVAQMKP